MKSLFFGVVLVTTLMGDRLARASEAMDINTILELAQAHNAELAVLRSDVRAAQARLSSASRWLHENPSLSGSVGPRLVPGSATRLQLGATVAQPIEFGGQRGARMAVAESTLGAAKAHLAARERALSFELRIAVGRALAAQRKRAIAMEAEVLASSALNAAVEREKSGSTNRIEVNSVRIELGRAVRQRLLAERETRDILGTVALLAGLESPITEVAGELAVTDMQVPASVDDASRRAKQDRLELESATLEVQAAISEQELAASEALPETSVGANYGLEEGATILQGTFSIELPFFERNQGERDAAAAMVERATIARTAWERRIEQEVRLALRSHAAARTAVDTYEKDVLEAITQNLALATEAYRAGKFNFLELMITQREAVGAQFGYVEALESLNTAQIELARALGSRS